MFGGVVGAPGLGLELHLHVGVDAAGVDGGYPDYAAFFELRYRSDARAARTLERRANRRARMLGLPYGDQGLLISRTLYDEVGGYLDVPLMEDVMIVRGINHYPQDIEATVAASHPSLRRDHGAAFTIVDDNGVERIVIVQEVERTQRHAISEAEVVEAIQAAVVRNHDVALYKIVLIRTGTLPKTTSGKVQRSLSRRRWLEGTLEPWSQGGGADAEAGPSA